MRVHSSIVKAAVREHIAYDLGLLKEPAARVVYATTKQLIASRSTALQAKGYALLLRLHSAAFSPVVDGWIVEEIRCAIAERRAGLGQLFNDTIAQGVRAYRASPKPDTRNLIGSHILVVKSASVDELGVIVVDYSNHFPLMFGLFDLPAIASRYTIVLEPSWAGNSAPEILLYSRLPQTVFIQTIEPRDQRFLAALDANLASVPIAANWWVDPRIAPQQQRARDIDVIMVAAWADIKRHWRVLRTLGRLRAGGHRLKVALVGYRYDRTKDDIAALARHYGIADQVELHEYLPIEEVNALLARSKVHVLWSRRECANRAIIEAMLADVPVIVRQGLTFGFPYPYVNAHTGRFVAEDELGDAILDMIRNRDNYRPRDWVMAHMTCHKATAVLEEHLRDAARADGRTWSRGLAVKTSGLYAQHYYESGDRARFAADYAFLEAAVRK